MRNVLLIMLCYLAVSCNNTETADTADSTVPNEKSQGLRTFPSYSTVMELLQNHGDFLEEKGCLKNLSEEGSVEEHIQVSRIVFKGEAEQNIVDQVKRDVIYVVYQAFAETALNEVKVTSMPLEVENINSKGKYLEQYKVTVELTREKAQDVLKKYLDTGDFKSLYSQVDGGEVWIPNESFNELKFDKLSEVFTDLSE